MLRSIQSKLFFNYSLFISIIILLFVFSFYLYTAKALEEKSLESIQSLSWNISVQLDADLSNLNEISKKIIASDQIKNLFFDNLIVHDTTTLAKQRLFSDLVFTILNPSDNNIRLTMFDLEGRYVSMNIINTFTMISKEEVSAIPWVTDTLAYGGKRLIVGPHQDDWSGRKSPVISLCRAFSKDYTLRLTAILEIQQDYSVISDIINTSLENVMNEKKVYIFSEEGQIIYPYPLAGDKTAAPALSPDTYWRMIRDRDKESGTLQNIGKRNSKEFLAYSRSDISGWTVVIVESEELLLKPVISFRNLVLFFGLLVLLITLVISFFVARGLTIPIRRLRKSVRNLSLETLTPNVFLETGNNIDELDALNRSFSEMCERLKTSLDETVASRSHEIQARMIALQSQMNPHFLYNTLSIISILAEDHDDNRIVKICDDLSNILRYISSNNTNPVSLRQEIEHTLSYINLIKIKYEDRLIFNLDIPDQLFEIQVPKLIIQPLVENCIKYGINVSPPWKINVYGSLYENTWELTVKDNGQGFTEQKLDALSEKLSSIEPIHALPDLNLDGMGLMNIYIRLKLLYGERAIFKLGNSPEGGAMVTIGGLTNMN